MYSERERDGEREVVRHGLGRWGGACGGGHSGGEEAVGFLERVVLER